MKYLLVILAATLLMLSCSNKEQGDGQAADNTVIKLLGAGATFPFPLYSKMFDAYYQMNNVKVNYQAIGSGGGIKQLLSKTVEFGATDAFMDEEEMGMSEKPIIHIPTCLGAVVVTYNLPGNPVLKLTPDIIADIFLGKIKRWNDKRIKVLNPEAKLLDQKIVIVHRSDGSGTTFIFSDYLSKVSSEWSEKVGRGKSLNWPVGLGGKGNQGVAGLIQQTPGSIGYTELIYAMSNDMPAALVQNKSGNFINPSISSVSQSANIDLPSDTRVSLTNTDAENGYPIGSFTWLILYNELNVVCKTERDAKALMDLLWWMIHDGQNLVEPLHYAPLPEEAVKKSEILLKSVKYNGKNVL
jgi:phosphate transport system substrate-binding protein